MQKKEKKTGDEVVGIRIETQIDEPAHAESQVNPRSPRKLPMGEGRVLAG